MLFPHGAVGSNQRRLDVAERGVDPFESRGFGGLRSGARDDRRVRAAGLDDGREAFQAVGDDLGAAGKRRARKFAQRDFAERLHPPQDDLMRLAVVCRFDRRDERCLARRAAPGPPWTFTAKIGVVHLDLALQAFRCVSFEHDLREFVLHLPGRRLCDPQPARKFDAGYPLLGLREVIYGIEP